MRRMKLKSCGKEYNQYYGAGWIATVRFETKPSNRFSGENLSEVWWYQSREDATSWLADEATYAAEDLSSIETELVETSGHLMSDHTTLEKIRKVLELQEEAKNILKELLQVAHRGVAESPCFVRGQVTATLFGENK